MRLWYCKSKSRRGKVSPLVSLWLHQDCKSRTKKCTGQCQKSNYLPVSPTKLASYSYTTCVLPRGRAATASDALGLDSLIEDLIRPKDQVCTFRGSAMNRLKYVFSICQSQKVPF
jgi:hypothetical protein